MTGTCSIGCNCDLYDEATKYFNNDVANEIVEFTNTDLYRDLTLEEKELLLYHKDGSPTLQSVLRLLGLDKITDRIDNNAIVRTIKNIAQSVNKNIKLQEINDGNSKRKAIGNMSRLEAMRVAFLFNQANPLINFVAEVIPHNNQFAVALQTKKKAIENMKKNSPIWAAVEGLLDFFSSALGVDIKFDTINDILGSVITREEDSLTTTNSDGSTTVSKIVKTVITVCSVPDPNSFDETVTHISEEIGKAAAKIIIEGLKNDFTNQKDHSQAYKRLEASAEAYIKANNLQNTTTIEEVMEQSLASEIQKRINKGLNESQFSKNPTKRIKDSLTHSKNMAGRLLDKLKSIFKSRKAQIQSLLDTKYNGKPFTIDKLANEARKAVDEMFNLEDTAKQTLADNSKFANKMNYASDRRQTVKKVSNSMLKQSSKYCNDTAKTLVKIERKLKKATNIFKGKGHYEALTEFEKMINIINEGINATNSEVMQTDIASKSLVQVLQQLRYSLNDLNTSLESVNRKLAILEPDMTNKEYIDAIKEYSQIHEEYEAYREIVLVLEDAINKHHLLSSEIIKITPDGNVARVNIKDVVDDFKTSVDNISKALAAKTDAVTLGILTAAYGSESIDIVIGKKFNIGHRSETKPYVHATELWEEELKNADKKNSWWQRIFGSIQNSRSLVNLLVGIMINQANVNANNATQRALLFLNTIKSSSNADMARLVERDSAGVPTGNLIRPVNYTLYEKELEAAEKQWAEEFLKSIEKEDLNYTQRTIRWQLFRKQKFEEWNRFPNEATGKTDFKMKKQKVVIIHSDNSTSEEYIYAPNPERYRNKQWESLTEGERYLSNVFFSMKYLSNQKLDDLGSDYHKIPMFRGSTWDLLGRNNSNISAMAANSLRQAFFVDVLDDEFGAERIKVPQKSGSDYSKVEMGEWNETNENEDFFQRIPLYGIRKLPDMRQLSTDLFSSYLAYDLMANNYRAKSNIESAISMIGRKYQLESNKQYGGDPRNKVHAFNRMSFHQEFVRYVDKELYGIKKKDVVMKWGTTWGVSLAKFLNQIGRLTTATLLGGNLHSTTVNLITGWNEITKEAGVGQYINITDLMKAQGFYIKHALFEPIFTGDILRHPNARTNGVDVILRDLNFTETFQHDIQTYNSRTATGAGKLIRLRQNLLMKPYEITDHWMLAIPAISVLHHHKVYGQQGLELDLIEALYPQYYSNKNANAVKKSKYYQHDGNFGLFYKSAQAAEEGELLHKALRLTVEYINKKQADDNAIKEDFNELTPKELEKLLELLKLDENKPYEDHDYRYDRLPNTLKEFKLLQVRLLNKIRLRSFNTSDYAAVRLKARELTNRMHGVYDNTSKGAINTSILGSTLLSMKNYAVGLINKATMQGHYNLAMGAWNEGTLITQAKIIVNAFGQFYKDGRSAWACGACLLSLLAPDRHHSKKAGEVLGFSDDLMYNFKRAKMNIWKTALWSVVAALLRGLGKGWFGGGDDDDVLLTYEALVYDANGEPVALLDENGLPVKDKDGNIVYKYETRTITKKDVDMEDIYKQGGELYSDITVADILNSIDFLDKNGKLKKINLNYPEEQVLLDALNEALEQGVRFTTYGSGDDKTGDDDNILGGYTLFINKIIEEHPEIWGKGGSLYRKKNQLKKVLLDAVKDGTSLKKTKMDYLEDDLKSKKELLLHLKTDYENETNSDLKKEKRQKLNALNKEIRNLNYIIDGSKYYEAKMNAAAFAGRERKLMQQYSEKYKDRFKDGIHTRELLKAAFEYDNPDDKAIYDLYCKDEKTIMSVINRIEKERASNKYNLDTFKENHPTAYYLLGVADYFAERVLLEQQSFLPGSSYVTEGIETVINSIASSNNKTPVSETKRNTFLNEIASLTGMAAATGAITSNTAYLKDLFGFLKYDTSMLGKDYQEKRKEIMDKLGTAENYNEMRSYYNELYQLEEDYNKSHAKNTTQRLKKGEPNLYKAQGIIPYWRSAYIFGLPAFFNEDNIEGGWNATKSFKSFYYKESK